SGSANNLRKEQVVSMRPENTRCFFYSIEVLPERSFLSKDLLQLRIAMDKLTNLNKTRPQWLNGNFSLHGLYSDYGDSRYFINRNHKVSKTAFLSGHRDASSGSLTLVNVNGILYDVVSLLTMSSLISG